MLTLFNSTEITRGQISSRFYRFKNELVENRNTLNIGEILLNNLAIPLLLGNPREMSASVYEGEKKVHKNFHRSFITAPNWK